MPRRLCDVCPYGCHWILGDMKWILCIGEGGILGVCRWQHLRDSCFNIHRKTEESSDNEGGGPGPGTQWGEDDIGWHVGPGTCTHHRGASPPWHNATGHLLSICCVVTIKEFQRKFVWAQLGLSLFVVALMLATTFTRPLLKISIFEVFKRLLFLWTLRVRLSDHTTWIFIPAPSIWRPLMRMRHDHLHHLLLVPDSMWEWDLNTIPPKYSFLLLVPDSMWEWDMKTLYHLNIHSCSCYLTLSENEKHTT